MRLCTYALLALLIACAAPPDEVPTPLVGTVVSADDLLPCTMVASNSGPRLVGSDSISDVGAVTARNSRGLYFSTAYIGGQLVVRDSTGSFVTTIGRPGNGPGEFAKGKITGLFIDGGDSIHVRHNLQLWSVFDSAGTYVRRTSAANMGLNPRTTHFLPDGNLLVAMRSRSNDGYFSIVDRDGKTLKSFGPIASEDSLDIYVFRSTALTDHGTFWAAPRPGSAMGYALEEWSLDGTLVRTLSRDVPWYKPGKTVEPTWPEKPPASIRNIHADSSGILFVELMIPKEPWTATAETSPSLIPTFFTHRYEAIDTRTGTLLASQDGEAGLIPSGFFNQSREGFLELELQDGTPVHQIATLGLVASPNSKSPGSCR